MPTISINRYADVNNWRRVSDTPQEFIFNEITPSVDVQVLSINSEKIIETYFDKLVQDWHKERAGMSSPTDMFNCEAYKEILALGHRAQNLIFKRMKNESDQPDFWFDALEKFNQGFSPVNEEDYGDMKAISNAWLNWAKRYGL